ncbi:MAG: HlyD family efflux transporter periplasmic adaptor subunit [Chloroflexi bacterium]|nr:HlyD family efflux transporter periplasmic adaptor subunit [Chloroflexota bacterium]MBV9597397.1 HlyD family efflux transporter periplasmic adaptor subunit [Chloroflexota bacterium]
MRVTSRHIITSRVLLVRLAAVLPVVLLTACQALQTPVAPSSHLNISPTANQSPAPQAGDSTASGTTTYVVKRDSLNSSLSLQGRVAPTRSAQLTLHGGGTVTSVNVQVGQDVKQGDPLAQFAADDQSLQASRTQATLAELAYEQEQSKLAELQTGTPKDTVDQAQAVVARDKAAIAQLNQQQQAAQDAVSRAQKAVKDQAAKDQAAKDQADRKVQLAQVSLQSAKDALAAAQDAAKQADDATKAAQTQAQTDADTAVASAKRAVTTSQRALKSATIKLSQAKLNWNQTRASQELETLQFKIGEDTDAVHDMKTADDKAQAGTAAQAAAADGAYFAAKRALEADQLQLKHDQTNMDASKTLDDAAIQEAQLDFDTAQDQLTQAQAAQEQAEQKAQKLTQQAAVAQSSSSGSQQLTPAAAQAAIKQAQHTVDTATINLQDAQAAADAAASGVAETVAGGTADTASAAANVPAAPDQSAMDAAQAQLSADQAKLTSLQTGTSSADISREQARVNLLHDQATAAAAAAQPIMTLKAPFDGTVTDVGITNGQMVAPGAATDGSLATAPAALAGQNNVGEPVAIRMVASGTTSIIADASESDVSQLNAGQSVNISFPGLSGQTVSAAISQIASTPTVKDGNVSYPVQIDLPSAPPNLKMGMTAQVSVGNPDGASLIAPRAAVQTVGGQSTVTRVDPNGQLESVQVQLGKSAGGNVQLLGGVQEGDKILMPATTIPLVAVQPPTTSQTSQP